MMLPVAAYHPRVRRNQAEAAGIAAGAVADAVFGDPRRGHPVALFGSGVAAAQRRGYADSKVRGAFFAGAWIALAVGAGAGLRRLGPVGAAAATFTALGGTSLAAIGEDIADALDAGDADCARRLVSGLVGRDPDLLDEAGICRAAVESIAENTSDATVAPLVYGALAGAPGLLGYRAVNTLDAMIGYRSERYRNFGWAAARADDAANLIPARLTAVLAGVLSGRPAGTWRAVRRDAGAHPSPNAGVVEAAFAGALGISLGGRTVYPHAVEERPRLGDGPPPESADLRAAVALSRRIQRSAAVLAVICRSAARA